MKSNNIIFVVTVFMMFILFEVALFININERFVKFDYKIKSLNIEIEELRKTQRLISQDAEYALRLVTETARSEGGE